MKINSTILKKFQISRVTVIMIVMSLLATLFSTSGCAGNQLSATGKNTVYVYNWGDYVDPDVLEDFEKETGIKVIVDEFDTNENMYPKVAAGATMYDVVCPSDYMIQKMIEQDLLMPLDYSRLPNAVQYTAEEYLEQAAAFDPGNKYAVPYCWGTVGIMYNKTLIDREDTVDSWSILWDKKYKNEILMQDSVRDAFMVALIMNGDSINTTDHGELEEAKKLLIKQKPLVQAYVIDEVRDKMVSGESALGVVFSGEALYMILENSDLNFVIPKEGTNLWIDAWVVPKNAAHPENAYQFINYMCRPDVAAKNCEYLTYSTPNSVARDYIEDEDVKDSEIIFPDLSKIKNLETYQYLGEEADKYYNQLWIKIKSA